MKKVAAAILGYGVVGQGIATLLTGESKDVLNEEGLDVEVKYCLDRSVDPSLLLADRIVTDVDIIMNDPEIEVVCECMGGTTASYSFSKRALMAGKHVVTSNKALVAMHGKELLALAAAHKVRYLYEASVGGGIPLLRNLRTSFPANFITRVAGVLNGTSNYILTRMAQEGLDFDLALKEAQALGYAENDPTDDIEGFDSARKITIIGSLLTASALPLDEAWITGIKHLNPYAFKLAEARDLTIRHIAVFEERGETKRFDLMVAPMLVAKDHPIAIARGVGNSVLITTSQAGSYLFAGPGAGGLATASAMIGDILTCFSGSIAQPFRELWDEPVEHFLTEDDARPVRVTLIVDPAEWHRNASDEAAETRQKYQVQAMDASDEAYLICDSPEMGYTEGELQEDLRVLGLHSELKEKLTLLRYFEDGEATE